MKKNLDFLIILFVCLLVFSALYVLYDNANKSSGSNVTLRKEGDNLRSHVRSSSSNFAFSDGFMDRSAISSVGVSGGSVSSSRISVPSPAPMLSRSRSLSSYSLVTSSVASSTNRTQRMTVFGDSRGGTSMGGSMIANSSQPMTYGGSMPNVVLSKNRRNSSGGVSPIVENGEIVAVGRPSVSPFIYSSNSYSPVLVSNPYRMSVYGNVTSLYRDATLAYGTADGPYRASRQHRAPPGAGSSGLGDTWGNSVGDWLEGNRQEGFGYENGGIWWFDEGEAEDLYDELFGEGSDYWNDGMGNPPTYEDFLDWLRSGKGNYRMPIGDIMPLFLIALVYMAFVFVSKRKN